MQALLDWLKANRVSALTALSAILTVLTLLNGAYHWLPADIVMAIWGVLAPFGIHSLLGGNAIAEQAAARAHVAEQKANVAHDRLDRVEMANGVLPDSENRVPKGWE